MLTGAVAGLATITPMAGYVTTQVAMLTGVIASVAAYLAVWFKNKKGWDDALDVWGVHGVGGFTGVILLGLFSTLAVNPRGANGLFYGNPHFFLVELAAVSITVIYAFFFTYGVLWLIDRITPVRVPPEEEKKGLDEEEFAEQAYTE